MGWLIGIASLRFGPRRARRSGSPESRPARGGYTLGVDRLGGDALDAGAQVAQALVDALVAAVDLADVADLAHPVRAQGGDEHGHAGADVGRLHPLAPQAG